MYDNTLKASKTTSISQFAFQALGLLGSLHTFRDFHLLQFDRQGVLQSVIVLVHPNLVEVNHCLRSFARPFCWYHVFSFVKAWKEHEIWNQLENLLSQLGSFVFHQFHKLLLALLYFYHRNCQNVELGFLHCNS